MSIDAKLQAIQLMSDAFTAQMNQVTQQIKDFQEKIGALFISFEVKVSLSEIDGVKWNASKKVFDYYKQESVGRVSSMKKHGQILSANLDARKRFVAHFDEILEVITEKYSTLHLAQEESDEEPQDDEVREFPRNTTITHQIYSRKIAPETVRDQFKLQAKQLVEDKRAAGEEIKLGYALDYLSRQAGYKNWNTCSAMMRRLENQKKMYSPQTEDDSVGNC